MQSHTVIHRRPPRMVGLRILQDAGFSVEHLATARDLFLAHCNELSALATDRFPIRQAGIAFGLYERREGGILKAVVHASEWEPKSGQAH